MDGCYNCLKILYYEDDITCKKCNEIMCESSDCSLYCDEPNHKEQCENEKYCHICILNCIICEKYICESESLIENRPLCSTCLINEHGNLFTENVKIKKLYLKRTIPLINTINTIILKYLFQNKD